MKRAAWILVLLLALAGCSGLDVPSREESLDRIRRAEKVIAESRPAVHDVGEAFPVRRDLQLRIRLGAVNRILRVLSGNRSDDFSFHFTGDHPLVTKEFLVPLSLDLDSGTVRVNIRKMQVTPEGDSLRLSIRATGRGKLHLTGRAIAKARVSPNLRVKADDSVILRFVVERDGGIALVPGYDSLAVEMTFRVRIFSVEIPWRHVEYFPARSIIPTIPLPLSIGNIVGDLEDRYAKRFKSTRLTDVAVTLTGGFIVLEGRFDWEREGGVETRRQGDE